MSCARIAALAALLGLTSGCFSPGEGVEPPLERLYFPVGLARSPAASRLYVVNSNFDLQYNGGTLQAYDLERLRTLVPRACDGDADCSSGQRCDTEPGEANGGSPSHWCVATSGRFAGQPCGSLGERSEADRLLEPGRCDYVNPSEPQDGLSPLIVDAVGIGAFATDVIYRSRPPASDGTERPGARLFVPVRGDATLHFIEVDDDSKSERTDYELGCGQDRNDGDCDGRHRAGDDGDEENTRNLRMPPEPFAVDATSDGEAIVVTHQTDGAASLFVNDWDLGFDEPPRLEFVTSGMPTRVVGVAAIPEPALVQQDETLNYQPGFLVSFRDAAELRLLRYFADQGTTEDPADPARPYLHQSSPLPVTANTYGFDSRGIAIDASERLANERACLNLSEAEQLPCLELAAGTPLRIFVANRAPASLLVGESRPNASATSSDDLPHFSDSIALPYGPSRVVVGQVIGSDGTPATRVFVVCFDTGMIAIYDPDARRIEHWIRTGRGPHAFLVDVDPTVDTAAGESPGYALAYVGHFTDSYIGVIDLDQRHSRTYGEIVLTVGAPTAPRASK